MLTETVKSGSLQIRIPEGIEFSLPLAGPVTRFLAWIVDMMCISAIGSIVGVLLGILGVLSVDLMKAFTMLAYFVISIGYGIALEWLWRGQTLGKRLLGLRVIDEQGLQLQLSQIVIRNLMRFVDSMPLLYFVGGVSAALTRSAQRLGDIAANTIVIRVPKVLKIEVDELVNSKFNSFRQYPHLCARLRQQVSPKEADIALQALLRRDKLIPQARLEVFAAIANHLKTLVKFPEEATEGISDEQYVRNAVDIVFKPNYTTL